MLEPGRRMMRIEIKMKLPWRIGWLKAENSQTQEWLNRRNDQTGRRNSLHRYVQMYDSALTGKEIIYKTKWRNYLNDESKSKWSSVQELKLFKQT